jgi:hypothetical protein
MITKKRKSGERCVLLIFYFCFFLTIAIVPKAANAAPTAANVPNTLSGKTNKVATAIVKTGCPLTFTK